MFRDRANRRQPSVDKSLEDIQASIDESAYALAKANAVDIEADQLAASLRQPYTILQDVIDIAQEHHNRLFNTAGRLRETIATLSEELRQAEAAGKALGDALDSMQAQLEPPQEAVKKDKAPPARI